MDLAAAHSSVSLWWAIPVLLLMVVGFWLRVAEVRRMAKGNRAAGRPWWKGGGGPDLRTTVGMGPGYVWLGVGIATAGVLFLVLFETVGGYHPRFNPLFLAVPIYALLIVQIVVVRRRRR